MSNETETFSCNGCGRAFQWKPELAGRRIRCKCGEKITVAAAPDAVPNAEVIASAESSPIAPQTAVPSDTAPPAAPPERPSQTPTYATLEDEVPSPELVKSLRDTSKGPLGFVVGSVLLMLPMFLVSLFKTGAEIPIGCFVAGTIINTFSTANFPLIRRGLDGGWMLKVAALLSVLGVAGVVATILGLEVDPEMFVIFWALPYFAMLFIAGFMRGIGRYLDHQALSTVSFAAGLILLALMVAFLRVGIEAKGRPNRMSPEGASAKIMGLLFLSFIGTYFGSLATASNILRLKSRRMNDAIDEKASG